MRASRSVNGVYSQKCALFRYFIRYYKCTHVQDKIVHNRINPLNHPFSLKMKLVQTSINARSPKSPRRHLNPSNRGDHFKCCSSSNFEQFQDASFYPLTNLEGDNSLLLVSRPSSSSAVHQLNCGEAPKSCPGMFC